MIKIVEKAAEKKQRERNEAIMAQIPTSNKEEVVCVAGIIETVIDQSGELQRRYMF
ncbi:MAG: hypothetical protein PHI38_07080 [Sulfurimonas sp.]|uniref:hypothetical protein n=1 Tax=Sulfurimonas sp. TaxID=2022749 RepID=UPI00260AF35A|nr:hypothetical protein [Sulfurimonas sp.]MDD3476616.1 hypothetical protein [Sulfurimonas sp.]